MSSPSVSQLSIYLQIANMLEEGILSDAYPEESQAPSTNELAKRFSINPATAAKGVNLLVEDGVLYKRRGLGMFVAEGAREKIRQKRRKAFYNDFALPLAVESRNLKYTDLELSQLVQRALDEVDSER
jgi:Predicted transcriptional regulators